MNRLRFKTILFSYLKERRVSLLLTIVCFLLSAVVYVLWRLPVEAVIYASLLCLVPLLITAGLRFHRYLLRVRSLEDCLRHVEDTLEGLPEGGGLTEELYHQLLDKLNRRKNSLILKADADRQEMTDYYTMWVHQIKTPIAAISLLLQTEPALAGSQLPAELFKIEQYVDMVLQYLRLQSPDHDLVLNTRDLNDIVREAVHKYARMFINKHIALQYDSVHCQILTDEKWLSFVIGQLLSNALKYTQKGQISIYLAEGQPKTLVIEDTGIGIAPEDLPRVFEKGYTGVNGRSDKRATGIGLYLSRRILTRLSHRISIDSVPGQGTRVFLHLDTVSLNPE